MKTFSTTMALFVAGAMLAGTAYAQTSAPSADKPKSTSDSMKPDSTKSDSMKSDSMKSDSMKSGGAMAGGKSERIKAAQQALKDKGADPGAIDGVMGPKTQAAVRDFQSKEGLKATGRLDPETMSKLGVQAKAGSSDAPSAMPSGSGRSGSSGSSTSSPTPPSGGSSGTK
jgi:pentapeptide MXKDX repeat protein